MYLTVVKNTIIFSLQFVKFTEFSVSFGVQSHLPMVFFYSKYLQ